MAATHESESFLERLSLVSVATIDELISSGVKQMENIIIDVFQFLDGVSGCRLDDVLWLRNTNLGELNTCFVLNLLELLLVLQGPESDASSGFTSSGSSS